MDVLAAAVEARRSRTPAAMVTVIAVSGSTPRSTSARMLVFADDRLVGTVGGGHLEWQIIEVAKNVISTKKPERYEAHLSRDLGMCCGGDIDVYIEPIVPEPEMVLFGAGHVAAACAPIFSLLGFRLTVVDERDEWNTEERFPGAHLHTEDPVQFALRLNDGPAVHALIVSHDHQLDQKLVELLLPKQLDWLGMIGSRTKVARFFLRLRAAGVDPTLFKRLCAPVGLDIGAETPEEIAVAIAAELVRVRRGATGTPVPLSTIPIPARGDDGQAVALALAPNPESGNGRTSHR